MESKLNILYEDNHLIAVYKPAGILVQADWKGERTLMDEVKDYLKEKYQKEGNVFLGLIHRLDHPVSGIILFAKTSKGASRLGEQFRNHTVKKVYQAVVQGVPKEKSSTLRNYLLKNENTNTTRVFDEPYEGALEAILHYKLLESAQGKSLVEVILETGRSHQIRAQLSHIGNPIVGDTKYGAEKGQKEGEIMLQATELHFMTATENKPISLKIPNVSIK
jgi:23S rRNA pseudouridine1911/1915/1917 synthase